MTDKQVLIDVEPREDTGKNACRRLRAEGKLPGIVYGLDVAPYAVSLSRRRVETVLRGEAGRNAMVKLALPGGSEQRAVMIRELQRDPLSEQLLHVDFVRVDLDKPVHVNVPVRLEGLPEGVKTDGGVLDFMHRTIEVSCLPTRIPEAFVVDVTSLHIGQHVAVSDIAIEEGVEILEHAETIIAGVAAPRKEEEVAVAADAEIEEGAEAAAAEGEGAPAEGEAEPAAGDDADKKS
jgi:large subunit ribosomal protein L25